MRGSLTFRRWRFCRLRFDYIVRLGVYVLAGIAVLVGSHSNPVRHSSPPPPRGEQSKLRTVTALQYDSFECLSEVVTSSRSSEAAQRPSTGQTTMSRSRIVSVWRLSRDGVLSVVDDRYKRPLS